MTSHINDRSWRPAYPVDEVVEVDLVDVDPAGAGGEDADVPMQRRSDLQVTVAADQSGPAPKAARDRRVLYGGITSV